MIAIGLWFLLFIAVAVGNIFFIVTAVISRRISVSFIVAVIILLVIILLEGFLLMQLRSQVSRNAAYWHSHGDVTPGKLVYIALGDSAAQGIGASTPTKGYVQLVANNIATSSGKQVSVVNLSRSGAKIGDVVRDQLSQVAKYRPAVVTIDIGANDIVAGTSEADMLKGYDQIFTALAAFPTVAADLPDFMWGTQQRNTEQLNIGIRALAKKHGVQIAPLHAATKTHMWSWNEYAADGFHPNDAGHKTWAAPFLQTINQQRIGQ